MKTQHSTESVMHLHGPEPLRKHGMWQPFRVGILALGLASSLLAGCTAKPQVQATQSETERQLVLAHAEDTTSIALATLYQQMLASVGVKAKLGEASANPVAEVLAGKADIVVAGSTNILAELRKTPENALSAASASPTPDASGNSKNSATQTTLSADQTMTELGTLNLGEYALLDSTEAHRNGILVTTASTSAAKNLNNLAQLPEHCAELEFGVPQALMPSLANELENSYACVPARLVPVVAKDKSPVQDLITNHVQVLGTTDDTAAIIDNGLVRLQDSEKLFGPQTLLPLITTNELGQDAIDAINKLSHALKQEDLIALNRAVTGRDSLPAESVAADWLLERNLVTK